MKDENAFYSQKYSKNLLIDNRLQKVLEIVKNCSKGQVLDLGCGDGSFSQLLREQGNIVFGVDISSQAVVLAAKRGVNACKVKVDSEPLPFKNNFFDFVFCGELIEHLYDPDFLLSEVKRVLKQGGLFVITTPNLASWFNRLVLLFGFQPYLSEVSLRYNVGKFRSNVPKTEVSGHIRSFTLKSLLELLEIHGFVAVRCYGLHTRFKEMPYIVEIFDKILSKWPSLSQDTIVCCKKN